MKDIANAVALSSKDGRSMPGDSTARSPLSDSLPLLHVLQHALGVDRYGQGRQYRNHFVAGGEDVGRCRELVEMGLMEERSASALSGGDPVFLVTRDGRAAVAKGSPAPPKLSRGQRRYRKYLAVADCFESFADFLRTETLERREARLGGAW